MAEILTPEAANAMLQQNWEKSTLPWVCDGEEFDTWDQAYAYLLVREGAEPFDGRV